MKTILILFLACLTPSARAAVVTLTAQGIENTQTHTDFSIGQNEVAELVSFPRVGAGNGTLTVIKDGRSFPYYLDTPPAGALIVAGPALFRLFSPLESRPSFCTIRVTPEPIPPDRTIIVPPGTNQARVTLECSTNLVHWFSATNGVYGPLPEAKFFRIKLEPVP